MYLFSPHHTGTTKTSGGESSASTPRTGNISLDLEGTTPRDLVITMKPVKNYHRKDICAVCARPVHRTKNIKYTTYHKVPCCTACYWFASKHLLKATYKDFKCLKNGKYKSTAPVGLQRCIMGTRDDLKHHQALDNHGCSYMNDQLVIHYTTATCATGNMEIEIF